MYMAGLHLAYAVYAIQSTKVGQWLSKLYGCLYGRVKYCQEIFMQYLVDGQTYIRLKAQIDVYVYSDSCSVDC